jgi:hypothetical protein
MCSSVLNELLCGYIRLSTFSLITSAGLPCTLLNSFVITAPKYTRNVPLVDGHMIPIALLSTGICFPVSACKYWQWNSNRWHVVRYKEPILNSRRCPAVEVGLVARFHQILLARATGEATEELRFHSRQREEIFVLSTEFRPAPGLTKPPIQLVPVALSPGLKKPELNTNGHLLPRSRIVKLYLHFPTLLHGMLLI